MRVLALVLAAFLLAGCGGHTGPSFVVGAVDDSPRWEPASVAKAKEAGFRADVLSAVWKRGGPNGDQGLRGVPKALEDAGIEPVLAVYQFSASTPLTDADRQQFASFAVSLVKELPEVRTVIVGNEPNLNLFWMPQFDASGGDAAAAAYEHLLATTYDALKAQDPKLTVVGGALAPRGGDDPGSSRPTHSPTAFLRDLGAAYRASGRTKPLMDELDVHVYGETPRIPPTLKHPRTTSIGIADYGKLVGLVQQAFGKELPIVYGEYGVESTVPPPIAQRHYTGHEVVSPVDQKTQGAYYRDAIGLASCQPDVKALYLFHVLDEQQLEGLQSGVYYADGEPKASLPVVRQAIEHPRCRR
ncbi:MAG TPA: hypothetical protein VHC67_12660 [Gaiellaceae bacterium]|nr:hypothetical protein [Gaiellaceae bacterium]